ncbi:MAG: hypothetical protein ACKODK_15790, partial [Opitutaceae bacterium]
MVPSVEWIDRETDVFVEVGLGTSLVLEEPFPSFAVGSDSEDGHPPDDLTTTTKGKEVGGVPMGSGRSMFKTPGSRTGNSH